MGHKYMNLKNYILYKSGVKNITEFFPNLFKGDLTTEAATGGVL